MVLGKHCKYLVVIWSGDHAIDTIASRVGRLNAGFTARRDGNKAV